MSATLWFLKPIALTTEISRLKKPKKLSFQTNFTWYPSNQIYTWRNRNIIRTKHLETPQRKALPGKRTQEKQEETQRPRKQSPQGERKKTEAKQRKQNHVHAKLNPSVFCTPTILIFLSCPFNSSLSSMSGLLCLQTSHYWCSFQSLPPPRIISRRTFDSQGILLL